MLRKNAQNLKKKTVLFHTFFVESFFNCFCCVLHCAYSILGKSKILVVVETVIVSFWGLGVFPYESQNS